MHHLDHPHVAPLWKRSLASWADLPSLAFLIVEVKRRDCSKRRQVAYTLLRSVYAVAATTMFGRTLGQRMCNIRVISQDTGRSPTLKQSLLMWSVLRVPTLVLTWWPTSPQLKQSNSTMKALKAEVEQLEQKYRGDREAKNRAIMAL